MPSRRRYKFNQSLSHFQILAKVKKEMNRQQQMHRAQQNLLYLNNSFSSNIQCQEIFLDLSKGKKSMLKSNELKAMYTLFSDNKANTLIFQKILAEQLKRIKEQGCVRESSYNKWTKETRGMMEIIEEQQAENQGQITTLKDNSLNDNNLHLQNQQDNPRESFKSYVTRSSYMRTDRSSIFEKNSFMFDAEQDDKEIQFLMKRVYCRLIEKILVKIAFYSMNSKHLNIIAVNMLEISRNLQTMIRRLHLMKDLRLLQQTILKVYKQNLEIQSKILQFLVSQGYILSIEQFYRINGIDAVHQQVYQRKSTQEFTKQHEFTQKEKIQQKKIRKDKINVIQKQRIVKTNKQINEKYLACISKIQQIIEEDKKDETMRSTSEKKRSSLNKTQPISRKASKKISRFASGFGISKIIQKDQTQKPEGSERSNSLKSKQKLSYRAGLSNFSPEFSKLIKESDHIKTVQRGSVLSQKIMQFNHFERGQRKRSRMNSVLEPIEFEKQMKLVKKKKSQQISTSAINKLIRLYESKHADRHSIEDFLTSSGLPVELRESLKQELMRFQSIYGSGQKRVARKQQSLYLSKTFSQSSYSSNSSKQVDEEEDYQFTKNSTKNSIEQKKMQHTSYKTLKSPLSSKDENKIIQKKQSEQMEISMNSTMDRVIQKAINQEPKISLDKAYKQNSFARLSKDRAKLVRTSQKITSQNLPVFTTAGVQNLQSLIIRNEQLPFKNQKLKRISYIRNLSRATSEVQGSKDENLNKAVNTKNIKILTQKEDSKMVSGLKIYKKAYQKNILSKTASLVYQKTAQQVVEELSKMTFQSHPMRIKERKQRSLHKLSAICQQRLSHKEMNGDPNSFKAFYPRWMNRTVHVNRTESTHQDGNNTFNEVNKKVSNTVHESCSQPVSPRNEENKENNFPYLYEIYDIRYRKKIQIPK